MRYMSYELSQEIVTVENRNYLSYGIKYDGVPVASNISIYREFVEGLVNAFNRNGLDVSQVNDVVEDTIGRADTVIL